MADEDEEDAWAPAEGGRPQKRERTTVQAAEEEESASTESTPSVDEEEEDAVCWQTYCGSAWKKMAWGTLMALIIFTIIVVILTSKATQLHADYTHKKAALNDVRSNYTRAMDTIRQNPSQSQCSRYEETFLNWLQSFCRIVNCTTELCHRSWTPFAGNCYFFSMSTLGWEESRQACVTLGSELVVIRSEEEQQFVAEYNASRAYWVGIKDNPLELTWTWVDGTILQDDLTFWDKDYPDSYFDYELEAFKNCVFLRGGAWANAVCARANYWICKRRSETPLIGL
ncbi:CD209 antigen-like protein C isoform X1 [Mobula hypostoma]|uniref:CD209 antigen-like protein C isoform X1 n=1 Tax=Mobula hypostoma TaxID=723540 RepID=UPI002FC39F21